jgi:hypothetical protein
MESRMRIITLALVALAITRTVVDASRRTVHVSFPLEEQGGFSCVRSSASA